MRLYLLDKLVCPHCRHLPLSVQVTDRQEGPKAVIDARPCTSYCAHEQEWLANFHYDPPCALCLQHLVCSGELTCSKCGSNFPVENGIPNLLVAEHVDDWVAEEKDWWEKWYAEIKDSARLAQAKVSERSRGVPGNRWWERDILLFAPLRRRGLAGMLVLEIGAGTSQYVAGLLSPTAERYFYIGTDVSRAALGIGSRLLPESDFVQCAVSGMPFRQKSFDVLLSLGVLHHVPSWQKQLERLTDLLHPAGWMLFDEAIEKPRVFGTFRHQSLTAPKDSPHEGEIALEELLDVLIRKGRVVTYRLKTTPLRVLLVWVSERLMERSILLTKAIVVLDQLFLAIAGRAFPSLGPGEVLGVFEKG